MRRWIAAVAVLAACSKPAAPPSIEVREPVRTAPVSSLSFNDEPLQMIATRLIDEARLRGIQESPGRNRVEQLLALEASLGHTTLAMNRVEYLVAQLTATDVSQWAKLRRKAEREFAAGRDERAQRVQTMLAGWQRRKSDAAYDYVSSNYRTLWMTSFDWERRFHDFVKERPLDAATWGWLVLREHAASARQQYGRADAETAYRFYLESSGLGDAREARLLFSVPGIQIAVSSEDARQFPSAARPHHAPGALTRSPGAR